jgi:hypothetical protein
MVIPATADLTPAMNQSMARISLSTSPCGAVIFCKGIDGDHGQFCISAQLTIPPPVRWMLVLEDFDEERLYFAKGLPREWVASGEEISITGASHAMGPCHYENEDGSGSEDRSGRD